MAPYFVEDIRKNLEQRFGAAALYETGLQVQTTLDVELQQAAERAVDRGLRRLDKRRSGFRKVKRPSPPPTRRRKPTTRRAGIARSPPATSCPPS
jgi:membrane carboxypeptidase/penicillin-binding protein